MLLEMKHPVDALQAFEVALQKEPNRFRTVYGAANAMSLAGDRDKARCYYRQLLEICPHADVPGRAESPDGRRPVQP
jgi:tetratricopeptide (TPR) repeat protein